MKMKSSILSLLFLALVACGPEDYNYQTREIVKSYLKNPTDAIFEKNEMIGVDTPYVLKYVQVDATNSFGGKIRSNYLVVLQLKGEEIQWNKQFAVQECSAPPTDREKSAALQLNGWVPKNKN